ncbi:uncharacterized protein A1O9_02073 [Exophiala aquamarina CBS 119918]|uniref:FAD dependent oxidoreductase domain-containing protein n=1 Tax=Exophiala aquamarina CBS 119918 TaxID=1182545 RepID=A0A072PL77_9EURO|nr:uncharacterized protein A1O9_02073 [Exophiala aquamarina CBS 119918]KEF60512.1 hypothetical protein A1O9_02073 [Exophiala aquamarina CBS 119918]
MTDQTSGHKPIPNSTKPFWRVQLHALDKHRSTSDLPTEADIVIIGSGFSGSALAHYIYEDNPTPPSVVILEAREACSGASARNGGHCKPERYYQLASHIKKYGAKKAIEVARFEKSQLHAMKELVEKENIDCDFTLTRSCDVILDPGLAKATDEAFAEMVKAGEADLTDVYHAKAKDAEMLSGVKGALSAFTVTAAHLWPYKLVMHLLQGAVNKGANLQTNTPVTKVSDQPLPDGRWLVATPRGSIKAKKIFFASNAYTRDIAPQFARHIIPVRGIASRIVVPEGKNRPFLPYTYNLRHGPGLFDYLASRADGSIVVGGAKPLFWHDRSHWYNVHDDSKLIESAKPWFDGLMQRSFAGWENSGAYTERVWTGIMGWTSDFMPYVGDVPGKPGQAILAGYSGHGMPMILLSARGLVQMMQGKSFEEVGIPELFKPTEERLASTKNEILDGSHPSSMGASKL